MPQTKADRQAAAKKGAATRERNRTRAESQERGTKAAATAQGNRAAGHASPGEAVGGLRRRRAESAAKSLGEAAKQAGKSAGTRSKAKS